MKRYTHIKSKIDCAIYDKQCKRILSAEEISKTDLNERMPIKAAVYPNTLLRRIAIPRKLIVCWNIIIFTLFIIFSYLFFSDRNNFIISPSILEIIAIPFSVMLSIFVHELNHAIIASCIGGTVAEIGIHRKPISYKTIVFFSQKTDADMCLFYSSGIVANMMLADICIILYSFTKVVLFFFFIISNYVLILLNSIPISPQNDGYKILSIIRRHRH